MTMTANRYLRTTATGVEDITKATIWSDIATGSQGAHLADAAAATVAALSQGAGQVVHDSTTVDSSGGGSAQTTNCTLVPANSLLLAVYVEVITSMDGDTTQILEVGVSGNIDNYIDTADFDPSAAAGTNYCNIQGSTNDMKTAQWIDAASQLVATWTNTASASAGSTIVHVIYVPLKTPARVADDFDTQFDAIIADVADIRAQFNTLLTRLEALDVLASS